MQYVICIVCLGRDFHYKAGVNFENFTEVKFRDILLTGTGHRDRRLNRDSPGQTGTYGRSNPNQNLKPKTKPNFRFILERPFAIPSFHQKCRPPKMPPRSFAAPAPLLGPWCSPVHRAQTHRASNRDTHLHLPHNKSSVHLTTTTYVRRSGQITNGMWSGWTTRQNSAFSSPTPVPTLPE